jgi:C1A family cysteine protease
MEEDDPKDGGRRNPNSPDNDRGGGGGGGMGWLFQLLPLAILFLFKRPKLLIPLLLLGGVWYFFLGGAEMLSGGEGGDPSAVENFEDENAPVQFSLGASLSQQRFDKAQVFEPLAYSESGQLNRLPRKLSLQQYAPRRMHQGGQGSCVGWASAYAARSILEARATGRNPNQVVFSPAYLYNQIHLENCQGAYMIEAMKSMSQNGSMPFQSFGYDESTCEEYPSQGEIRQAQQFRIKGYNRLTVGAGDYTPDIMAIKQNLAQGAPVVIGMMVGGSFMNNMIGRKVWQPTQRDYNMSGFGGHAMCVIGYDDDYQEGALQIMNSWGEDWGDRGLFWMRYDDFEYFTKEAYGLYPMGSAQDKQVNPTKMAVEFGLYDNEKQAVIPVKQVSDIVFRTNAALRKGQKFKALIANSVDCYVYIFGQETDGSSYVLFPYTEKHDPYCGIVGTRLFPKDHSMVPDAKGQRDYMAIVVSKKELDYEALNEEINSAAGNTYAEQLKAALGNQRMRTTSFKAGNSTIAFEADVKDSGALVGVVIEVDKQ